MFEELRHTAIRNKIAVSWDLTVIFCTVLALSPFIKKKKKTFSHSSTPPCLLPVFSIAYSYLSFLFLSFLFVLKGVPGSIGEFGLYGLSGASVRFKYYTHNKSVKCI